MGEAKRRGQLGRLAAEHLRQRQRAGDFGAPGSAGAYLFVLDKSPAGQELLAVLRAVAADFPGLSEALEGETFRLWSMSAVFPFVVLHGGEGSASQRTQLAGSLTRLLDEGLPRAVRWLRPAGGRWSAVAALAEPAHSAVGAALERLRD